MNRLKFVQLQAENRDDCASFEQLMRKYIKELDSHQNLTTPTDFIEKWIKSIIQIQGDGFNNYVNLNINRKPRRISQS